MLGEACALGAALTWSVSVILFKRSEKLSPQALNLFKNSFALVLLLVTLPALGVSIDWQRPASDWWRLALSGVLGLAIADTLVFMALRRLGAAMLAIIDCAYAPTIVLLSVLFLDERVGPAFGVGGLLVVGGVLAANTEKLRRVGAVPPKGEGRVAGIAFGVAGIMAMAAGVILAKPALEHGHLVEVTLVRLFAGVLGQLAWMVVVPSQRGALVAFRPSRTWRTLVPASLLGSYVAMLLWLGGFKWASASIAAVLNQLSSIFTMILARVVLLEPVTPRRALGAAVAVGGAVLILVT
jgi:drug/metabolite transporter (DMT)-like permease